MDAEHALYINVEDALKRVGGNEALFRKLLNIFAKDDHYEKIARELDSGDTEAALRSTHSLKGVSSNLSLIAVTEVSVELERKLKNKLDYTDTLENLKSVLEVTLTKINDL